VPEQGHVNAIGGRSGGVHGVSRVDLKVSINLGSIRKRLG
jgi:hypothetical protein